MKFLLVFGALAVSSALQARPTDGGNAGRIFNGQNAKSDQFPYTVRLEIIEGSSAFLCGGSLIGHNWVLTAAHCIFSLDILYVYLGMLSVEDAVVTYTLNSESIIFHPNWDPVTGEYDIALVHIPATEYCGNVAPVRLPKMAPTYPTYVDTKAVISGWGKLNNSQSLNDLPLQWANVVVISHALCEIFYWNVLSTEYELCAVDANKASPCTGDSGGPLVLESTGELIGVIQSMTEDGCEEGAPVIYTRVTYFLEWIKSETGIWY